MFANISVRTSVIFAISILFILNVAGCASVTPVTKKGDVKRLEARVVELEKQLRDKDSQIDALEDKLMMVKTDKISEKAPDKSKSVEIGNKTPKNIQLALKNAGFYSGPVDGTIGKATRNAIKAFQRSSGLQDDGIVGRKTWEKLEKYLTKYAIK